MSDRAAAITDFCHALDVALAWRRMDEAIDRLEYHSMVGRETDDPFWDAVARRSNLAAIRAVAVYENAVGGASA